MNAPGHTDESIIIPCKEVWHPNIIPTSYCEKSITLNGIARISFAFNQF